MCGKPVTGFGYFCEENDRCLHPFCHIFPSSLKVDDLVVEFKLLDKYAALSSSKCFWCKKKRLEGSTVSGNIPASLFKQQQKLPTRHTPKTGGQRTRTNNEHTPPKKELHHKPTQRK
ncbi:hypothetical protein Dsin_004084 [Dipteronia sinensis]|uniref:Uncharacterized protein n=1 Tax=Dipteronia sinensis TaxID=43782 RepID=A0AAE0BA67_9ROSI|nr:hypothetical protein Dsin_004084 [Dipteronia sinensis]